ncbi:MAG: hypothetical protein Ct9H300mP19_07320 [Dehalococcoidia bacterium]|nr:MAG: hypothetical protein Ct9H300mP19_07320 [Dehalococcoidia bacterium]
MTVIPIAIVGPGRNGWQTPRALGFTLRKWYGQR